MTEFHNAKSFQYMAFNVLTHMTLLIILIYCPPKPLLDFFFFELNELLTLAYAVSIYVIVLGDFKLYFDSVCSNASDLTIT